MYITDLVSVVIPTRGRSETLVRAIKSVLSQTHHLLEVIIVNDNDPDSPMNEVLTDCINSLHDNRLTIVSQKVHINGAVARNIGIKASKGEYISFLDDDDWWDETKIEHQLAVLKKQDSSVGAVACLKKYYKKGKIASVSLPYKEGYICKEVISRCIGIGIGAPLIRRTALDDTGYFDEALLRMQDIQLYGFLCFKYKIILLKEYLYSIDQDDNRNRPDATKILKIREDYLKSISPILDKMNSSDKSFVKIMMDFEVVNCLIKNGKIASGLSHAIRVFSRRDTVFFALSRIIYRYKGIYLINYYLKKYGTNN